ncbi:MAG TPA: hypothetical protein VK031_05760 [Tissierellaceae bacterium]|nr:hypothetical protein [Tissierellaceae bacterium]
MKVSEKIKDILYESMDYLIMLGIIVTIALIIGWRLDALFAKESSGPESSQIGVEEGQKDDSYQENGNDPKEDGKIDDEDKEPVQDSNSSDAILTINIPEGSFPSQIASILESQGVIEDSNEFIQKSQEMGLDRKLQSGSFQIEKDASLEELVRIIAKEK